MAFFRCMNKPNKYVLFSEGQWQNLDRFDVTLSETGAQYLSIVNGELVYGNGTTGFSVYSKTDTPFVLVIDFYSTSGFYMQTGRCARGADARVVQETGQNRYSYHNWNPDYGLPYAVKIQKIGDSYAAGHALFVSGTNYMIKSVYAYEYQNNYCFQFDNN